jgi:hypothetical protein
MRPNGLRKDGYRSRAKANQARIKRQPNADTKLYIYRCPHCTLFHLTSQPQGTAIELVDGAVVVINKPADQVERDIAAAQAGDYTHIRWDSQRTHRPIPVQRIRRVIRDEAA